MKRWVRPFGYLLLLAAIGGAFVAGFVLAPEVRTLYGSLTAPLSPFGEAWYLVEQSHYGSLPEPAVRLRGAIRGILAVTGDKYTILLDPQPALQEQQRLAGRYGDIGVSLWWGTHGEVFLSPYSGGPAASSGVQPNDQLLAIDGQSLAGITTLDPVAQQLAGPVGTTITLSLLRPPTLSLTLTVGRAEVVHPSIETRIIDSEKRVGWLRIAMFTAETAQEVEQALQNLEHSFNPPGAATRPWALVLDLRGNGGGLVAPLPRLSGFFLPEGSPVYYQQQREGERAFQALGPQKFSGPLVVLVDGGTASASEIVAAALWENGRAILIGEPTLGKGSVQNLYPLRDGSTLHITSAVWLTPQRHRLEGGGLAPDQPVSRVPGRDAPLEAALRYLYEKLP